MINLIFAIGTQGWVPLPLCFPITARFIEAVGLSLDILILIGQFFYYRHQVLVGGGEFGVVGH